MASAKSKFILLFALVFGACGVYSVKGSLPAHIKSISLSPVINESAEFNISQDLENQITQKFISENVLDVTGEDVADSRLNITIKSVKDQPYTIKSNQTTLYEKVEEWRITISVHVVWYDLKRDEPLLDETISKWGAYGTGLDIHSDGIDNDEDGYIDDEDDDEFGSPRESAMAIAVRKLSEWIVNEITSTW